MSGVGGIGGSGGVNAAFFKPAAAPAARVNGNVRDADGDYDGSKPGEAPDASDALRSFASSGAVYGRGGTSPAAGSTFNRTA